MKTDDELRIKISELIKKWKDAAAFLERNSGRLDAYNAYTADALRACRVELSELIEPTPPDER